MEKKTFIPLSAGGRCSDNARPPWVAFGCPLGTFGAGGGSHLYAALRGWGPTAAPVLAKPPNSTPVSRDIGSPGIWFSGPLSGKKKFRKYQTCAMSSIFWFSSWVPAGSLVGVAECWG